tara:strand:- start:716 stop:943 length:228 start_codon:yes stop_codon:yes gene_type:complete
MSKRQHVILDEWFNNLLSERTDLFQNDFKFLIHYEDGIYDSIVYEAEKYILENSDKYVDADGTLKEILRLMINAP